MMDMNEDVVEILDLSFDEFELQTKFPFTDDPYYRPSLPNSRFSNPRYPLTLAIL